jgi:hypothetical protein
MNPTHRERLQWAALTMVGLVAGITLALPLGVPIFAVLGAMAGTPVVLSIVGLGLGTAQWPIIRRHISSSGWWIVASLLGMALGLTVGVVLVEQIGRALTGGPLNFRMLGPAARAASFGTIGVMAGASLGLFQWLVLRRQAPGCRNWIVVNAWSLGLGLASGSLLADALVARSGSLVSVGILLVIGGGIAGASTARAFTRIFPSGAFVAGR